MSSRVQFIIEKNQPPPNASVAEIQSFVRDMAATLNGDADGRRLLLSILPEYSACSNPELLLDANYGEPVWDREHAKYRSVADMSRDLRLTKPIIWDLPPYTARGLCSLVYSPPKAGKSTWAGYYVREKSRGGDFMGTRLEQSSVLVVAPDEPERLRFMRYRQLDVDRENVFDWQWKATDIPDICAVARELEAGLVVADTLVRIARPRNEDDNAEWDNWFAENLPHIRDLDVPWLFLAHERKSGGKNGESLRGASAILAAVDIAFSIHRVPTNANQRRLTMEATRIENTPDTLMEIGADGTYKPMGSVWKQQVMDDLENQRILAVLRDGQQRTIREIWKALNEEMADATIRRRVQDKLIPARILEVACDDPLTVKVGLPQFSAPLGGRRSGEQAFPAVPHDLSGEV